MISDTIWRKAVLGKPMFHRVEGSGKNGFCSINKCSDGREKGGINKYDKGHWEWRNRSKKHIKMYNFLENCVCQFFVTATKHLRKALFWCMISVHSQLLCPGLWWGRTSWWAAHGVLTSWWPEAEEKEEWAWKKVNSQGPFLLSPSFSN